MRGRVMRTDYVCPPVLPLTCIGIAAGTFFVMIGRHIVFKYNGSMDQAGDRKGLVAREVEERKVHPLVGDCGCLLPL